MSLTSSKRYGIKDYKIHKFTHPHIHTLKTHSRILSHFYVGCRPSRRHATLCLLCRNNVTPENQYNTQVTHKQPQLLDFHPIFQPPFRRSLGGIEIKYIVILHVVRLSSFPFLSDMAGIHILLSLEIIITMELRYIKTL